jgi:large subunit ribosomal protein L25
MPERPVLPARRRAILGKQVKRLRRAGFVSGVVYGPVLESPLPVMVELQTFERLYDRTGTTTLLDLQLDDATYWVFVREAERHPVTRKVLNIEFYAPDQRQPVNVRVPIAMVGGLPAGIDGIAALTRQEIEVRALPERVPQQIEVDLALIGPERLTLRAGDLLLPEGVELASSAQEVILVVAEPAPAEAAAEPQQALAEEIGDRPAAVDEGARPIEEG